MADRPYVEGLAITSQFFFCGLPLRLDTFPKCSFACAYCFAIERGGRRSVKSNQPFDSKMLDRRLSNAKSRPPSNALEELLQHGQPIHFGGMYDPFTEHRGVNEATVDLLRVLKDHRHPVVISTKATSISDDNALNLLTGGNAIVQVSFSTFDDELARKLEPGAPPPSARLRACEVLSKAGIPVALRFQPVIPTLDRWVMEGICSASEIGAFHIGVEFLKLGVERNSGIRKRLSLALAFDVELFYSKSSAVRTGREFCLPVELRVEKHLQWRECCHRNGMSYGFADSDLVHLSDTECCCSGADRIQGFDRFHKLNVASATRRALSSSTLVKFESVGNEFAPKRSVRHWLNSNLRASVSQDCATMRDYVRAKWNQTKSPLSPGSLYGVTKAGEDDEGLFTYELNRQVVRMSNPFGPIPSIVPKETAAIG